MTTAATTAPAPTKPKVFKPDAKQLTQLHACKAARTKRDKDLATAQKNYATDVAKANREFAKTIERATKFVPALHIAKFIGMNRPNLHHILSRTAEDSNGTATTASPSPNK